MQKQGSCLQEQNSCLQDSVVVKSVSSDRQNTPYNYTRDAFLETSPTCIWLTLSYSYEAWYCTSILNRIRMLVHNVIVVILFRSRFEKAGAPDDKTRGLYELRAACTARARSLARPEW